MAIIILTTPGFLIVALVTVSVKVRGQVHVHPENGINVTAGDLVHLYCQTKPGGSVDWQYSKSKIEKSNVIYSGNGGKMEEDYEKKRRFSVQVDATTGQYNLTVVNITKFDEGLYRCSDSKSPDGGSAATHVYVLDHSLATLCPLGAVAVPAFSGYESRLAIETDGPDGIQLERVPFGSKHMEYVYHEGKLMADYESSGRFSVNFSSNYWSMLIKNATVSDAGRYTFSENNGLGKQSHVELVIYEIDCKCPASCTIKYTGNCGRLSFFWKQQSNNETQDVAVLSSNETVTVIANVTDMKSASPYLCVKTEPATYICTTKTCTSDEETTSDDSSHTYRTTAIVVTCVLLICGGVGISIFACLFRKRRKEKASKSSNEGRKYTNEGGQKQQKPLIA